MAQRMKEIGESEQNLLKRLNLDQSSQAPKSVLSEKQMQVYRSQKEKMFDIWRRLLANQMEGHVQIIVKNKFRLQERFDLWAQPHHKSSTYLFNELDEANCGVWLKKWEVFYKGKLQFNDIVLSSDGIKASQHPFESKKSHPEGGGRRSG